MKYYYCTSRIFKIDVVALLSTTDVQILKTFLHATIMAFVRTRKRCVTVRIFYQNMILIECKMSVVIY